MSAYLEQAKADLNTLRDQRIVRDMDEIEIQKSELELTVMQLPKIPIISPITYEARSRLATYINQILFAMDALYAQIQQQSEVSDKVRDKLLYMRDATLQQFCCNHDTMNENHTFYDGPETYHYRFDIICFLALLETAACLCSEPNFRASTQLIVPSTMFPKLCEARVVKPALRDNEISDFTVFDVVESLKYLEFKWCSIPYIDELHDYLDLLLCRIAELYKNPQNLAMFGNITDYMKPHSATKVVCSERMIEEMCWSLRPMYQKIHIRQTLGQHIAEFAVPDEDVRLVQKLSVDNARRMNNKDISDKDFRNKYTRFALRPSEIQRAYRDKRGKYLNAVVIMKNSRSKETVDVMMDKLDEPAWVIVGDDENPPLFDAAGTDLMYLLLIDSWVGNMWQLEWIKTFVIYNIDLLHTDDSSNWFRVKYPLIVQSFNHFDVYFGQTLYRHENAARAFCHWYSIMMMPPFKGRYDNRNLVIHELTNLQILGKQPL